MYAGMRSNMLTSSSSSFSGHYAQTTNSINNTNINTNANAANLKATPASSNYSDAHVGGNDGGGTFQSSSNSISNSIVINNRIDLANSSSGGGGGGCGAGSDDYRLLRGIDTKKDQSYFLAGLTHTVLERTLFPLGGMLKPEVKQLAHDLGLPNIAAQKESMGICFIGKRRFDSFLGEYLEEGFGKKILVKADGSGCVDVGEHSGLHSLTVGQRASVGGLKAKPYVAGKHLGTKEIFVVEGEGNPALFSHSFAVGDLQWTAGIAPWELCPDTSTVVDGNNGSVGDSTGTGGASSGASGKISECMVQIRHQHASFHSTVTSYTGQPLPVGFENPDVIGYVQRLQKAMQREEGALLSLRASVCDNLRMTFRS